MSTQGIFDWTKTTALSHHCGVCEKPMSNPTTLRTCLGTHMEVCKEFHPIFFRKGRTHDCKACINSLERDIGRHQEMVKVIKEIRDLEKESEDVEEIPSKPRKKGGWVKPVSENEEGKKLSKRERKDQKALSKAKNNAVALPAADVEKLGTLLHGKPDIMDIVDWNELLALVPQVARIVGSDHVFKKCTPKREAPDYTDQIQRICGELKIPIGTKKAPLTKTMSTLTTQLKELMEGDLESVRSEQAEVRRRAEGLCRFINRAVFAQLMKSGEAEVEAGGPGGQDAAMEEKYSMGEEVLGENEEGTESDDVSE
ncbi:hypothetical protein M501DRAFT_1031853 [Patellaria atrata CBS 101060]|uniref:Uncharacterized protein n=1 Tax=Patellaria atrata CBS 101060 TaxID=1346257 RepID=A0A9P4VPG9_9PEZI|nr:hypothetical protein M501DRAFT_1031853 [Patellaria atrata CBS 101060]